MYLTNWVILFNVDLNPICHLLAFLGAHLILHVSGIRVKGFLFDNLTWLRSMISRLPATLCTIYFLTWVFLPFVHVV